MGLYWSHLSGLHRFVTYFISALETVDQNRFTEYYRYFDTRTNRLKGDFSDLKDPLQIGIIRKIRQKFGGSIEVRIRKLLRPENTSMSNAEVYKSDLNEVFWTEEEVVIDPSSIEGKCFVLPIHKVIFTKTLYWAE